MRGWIYKKVSYFVQYVKCAVNGLKLRCYERQQRDVYDLRLILNPPSMYGQPQAIPWLLYKKPLMCVVPRNM